MWCITLIDKINTQKYLAFLYTNNEKIERKIPNSLKIILLDKWALSQGCKDSSISANQTV